MKRVVVKLDLHDDKAKQKAMKAVSSITGIDSMAMDMENKKLTVIGNIDPIDVVTKLKKKWCCAEILTVGPAKEPEKQKEEPKKEEPKKQESKKEEPKKEEPKKEDEQKKYEEQLAALVRPCEAYHPHCTRCCHAVSIEEDPNACVIC